MSFVGLVLSPKTYFIIFKCPLVNKIPLLEGQRKPLVSNVIYIIYDLYEYYLNKNLLNFKLLYEIVIHLE